MRWALLSIPAAMLLYLLSVPPVVVRGRSSGRIPGLVPPVIHRTPHWAKKYAAPYDWLMSHTPLRDLLLDYCRVWGRTDHVLYVGWDVP